jgi:hypothetical protein
VFVQFKNAALVKTEPFPHGVTALHRRIERTDSGQIAMHELAVDVHDQVAVLLVKLLEHDLIANYADFADIRIIR